VASGGAIKAACFHMGVCLALKERGFEFLGGLRGGIASTFPADRTFTSYVGSSAGAFFCAMLASGYQLDEISDSFSGAVSTGRLRRIAWHEVFRPVRPQPMRYVRDILRKRRREGGLESYLQWAFPGSGLFRTDGIADYLRKEVLPATDFHALAPELYITGTALDYSRKVVFGPRRNEERDGVVYEDRVSIQDAVAASTALPPVFRPYEIKNGAYPGYYFDGEIRDTLSTGTAKDIGADLIIASYTHQPYHYHQAFGSLIDYGIPSIAVQAIYLAIEQKIRLHKRSRQDREVVMEITDRFFREHKLDDRLRRQLLDELTLALRHRPGVDYIFLHPEDEAEFFFAEHFDLSRRGVARAVQLAHKHALNQLKPYIFSWDQAAAEELTAVPEPLKA
jgi:predicted acylesterase/phospholipase RssA